jgi:chaperonin GroES
MKIRPLQDRIILKRTDGESVSKGGILIPDAAKEKPLEGEVVAVGAGKNGPDGSVRALLVKVGDIVLFAKYAGTDIKIEGVDHLLLREEDILCVLDK